METDLKTENLPSMQPPKFVASTEGLPPPLDDNAVKAIFDAAAKKGLDDLNTEVSVATSSLTGQSPIPQVPIIQASMEVPPQFKKQDGTVDEEKLKISSAKLDEAIQEKRKSVDEMLAEYKAKRKEWGELGEKKKELEKGVRSVPIIPPPQNPMPQTQEFASLQAQVANDYQRDPIGTQIMLAQAAAQRLIDERLAPVQDALSAWQEQRQDESMRQSLSQLVEKDPRVLNPQLYAHLKGELESDPGYFNLKNPHKAAWNEVKERLRLGEPEMVQAQPSMNPSPTLRGGSPPSVSSLPQPVSVPALQQSIQSTAPLSEDGKRIEDQLREITRNLWQ